MTKKQTNKPRVWKQKYNFDKIKLDFFRSADYHEVKAFFINQFGTYTEHIKRETAGWTKEKKEMISKVKDEAMKEAEAELKEYYKPTMKQLAKIHEANIWAIQAKAFQIAQNIKTDSKGNIILPDWFDIKEQEIINTLIKREQFDLKSRKKEEEDDNEIISTIRVI